jgi:hypothetical protein
VDKSEACAKPPEKAMKKQSQCLRGIVNILLASWLTGTMTQFVNAI